MRRSTAATIAIAGLVAFAAWTIWRIVDGNRVPNGYFGRHGEPSRWSYPIADTVGWAAAIAAEAVVSAIALRHASSLAFRALTLACFGLVWFLLLAVTSMYARLGWSMHVLWLLFATIWLVAIAILSAIAVVPDPEPPIVPLARVR